MDILLMAALIPPLFLLVRIYQMDKIEREPVGLVLKVFLFGAVSTVFAALIEGFGQNLLLQFLNPKSVAFKFLFFYFVVAWAEEGVKHFALKHGTWRNPAFNYHFDAVVYSVAAALGFAAFENVNYVTSYGLGVAVMRALTAIPGHCIFGIFMGFYYGMAKYHANRGDRQKERLNQFLSIFVPLLLHGFYDFCASSESEISTAVFFIFIIILDIVAFRVIRKMARNDSSLTEYDISRLSR